MEILLYSYMTLLGLLFGSFGSVLIYRLKSGEKWILTGRSHCRCGKKLSFIDLIPLFGWILQKGRCNQCNAKISPMYPCLEVATAGLFLASSYFLVDIWLVAQWNITEVWQLLFWLFFSFITILYTFYDIAFMEIHDGIMGAWIVWVIIYLCINGISSWYELSAIWIVIVMLIGCYTIMLKWLSNLWDIIIIWFICWVLALGYHIYPGNILIEGSIGAMIMFLFFFVQILVSWWTWMGGWDLRIALMVGLILGTTLVWPGIFITYLAGSVISLSIIAVEKVFFSESMSMSSKIPFGPFIAIGCCITLFFQANILHYISIYL